MPTAIPDLHFRVATAADLPLVHTLVESAYRGDESRLGWTTEADLLAGTRIDDGSLLAKITNPAGAVLLAYTTTTTTTSPPPSSSEREAAETLLGCCEISQQHPSSSKSAYFALFAVSPRQQNAGVGRRVLAHAEAYAAREWGVARVELTVVAARAELLAWYVRRGYRVTGVERPFPEEELEKMGGKALVDWEMLRFLVLEKILGEGEGVEERGVVVGKGDGVPTPLSVES